MVGSTRRSIGGWASVLLIGAAIIWLLVPSITTTSADPNSILVRESIGTYREAHGVMPPSLLDILPFLKRLTNGDCRITQNPDGTYLVLIRRGGAREERLEVNYKNDPGGLGGHYSVRNMD